LAMVGGWVCLGNVAYTVPMRVERMLGLVASDELEVGHGGARSLSPLFLLAARVACLKSEGRVVRRLNESRSASAMGGFPSAGSVKPTNWDEPWGDEESGSISDPNATGTQAVGTTPKKSERPQQRAGQRLSGAGAMPGELDRSGPSLPFRATLDVCELDDRRRPGVAWIASACELSRSQISFRSRRMCHVHREVVMAVHMVDAEPVPLFGEVAWCEYIGEGLYRTDVSLAPLPEGDWLSAWLRDRKQRSHV